MRKVFSNTDEVIHVWAQQKQHEGRNSTSSISFEGETLVSYDTPIARFYTNKRGEKAVLVSFYTYSNTTAQQISSAIHAVRHHTMLRVLHISDSARGRAPSLYPKNWHETNIENLHQRYAAVMLKLSRTKKHFDLYERDMASLAATAQRYCEFFDLGFNASLFPPVNPEQLAMAKNRAMAAAKAEAKKTAEANKKRRAELNLQLDAIESGELPSYHISWDWKKYADAKQQKRILTIAEKCWLKGNTFPGVDMRDLAVMLRVDGEEIQTSWRARFPVEHGKKAFKVIMRCRENGEAWQANGHTLQIGHYAIDSINPRGDVVAGCHMVYWPAIERVAKELGLI